LVVVVVVEVRHQVTETRPREQILASVPLVVTAEAELVASQPPVLAQRLPLQILVVVVVVVAGNLMHPKLQKLELREQMESFSSDTWPLPQI
jgi:hypothetical protein